MRGDAVEINQPKYMNADLAWFLGYLWGDGAQSPAKYRIRFTDGVKINLLKMQRILREQFNIESNLLRASEERNAWVLDSASKMLWHWLIKNGFYKYFSDDIDLIPTLVRKSSKKDILAFLAGLSDSDGCVSATKEFNRLIISTASDLFAKHIQDVAASVGIIFGRSLNKLGQNFQKRKHMWLLGSTCECDENSFLVMASFSNKMSFLRKRADLPWCHKHENHRRARTLGKVKSCELIKKRKQTYDIEVENNHWYYAGAFKSHNTLSLLPQVTPGVHPAYAPYYIRRIRMASDDPLVDVCRKNGYYVEPVRNFDGSFDRNTAVVSFPVKTPEGAICAKELTAVQQMEWHKWLQTHWADNSVSVTVYYKKEELPEIQAWLKDNYNKSVKTISFLLHKDHGFQQAPYEEISKEQYEEISSKVKPITSIIGDSGEHELSDNLECSKGSCPVR
jgi:hypothetical protein